MNACSNARDDPATWNQARIAEVIKSQETKTMYLRQPLPVLLLYWTAMAGTEERSRSRSARTKMVPQYKHI